MFKLQQAPTFEVPVSIHCPGRDPKIIQVEYKALRKEEIDEFSKKLLDRAPDPADIAELLHGWKDVDAPCTVESLTELEQNYPFSMAAFWSAYYQAYIPNLQGN